MKFWYPGFLYGAVGVMLLYSAFRRDAALHTLWARWRKKPATPMTPPWRITLAVLGALQIALGLLTGFGMVR
jgi:hypothetical protein